MSQVFEIGQCQMESLNQNIFSMAGIMDGTATLPHVMDNGTQDTIDMELSRYVDLFKSILLECFNQNINKIAVVRSSLGLFLFLSLFLFSNCKNR